jgi:hypothetical protein
MIKITPPPTPHTITTETLHQILDALIRSERTIPEIAAEFKLTYVAFQQLLESPEARAELDALRVISAIRHDAAAPVRRENALARLTHIAAFNLDEISGRRAATTLLRELRTKLPAPSAQSTAFPVPPTGVPVGAEDALTSTSPTHPKPTDAPSRPDARATPPLPMPPTGLPVSAADPKLLLTTSNPKPKHLNPNATTAKTTTASPPPHPPTHNPRALLATH